MAVTDADVKAIIDTDRDTTPFIADALLLVNEIIVTSANPAYSSDRLDLITKYLAAHFVWITESSGLAQKDVGHTREVYRTYSDKSDGLASSRYGQSALSLDTQGILAKATTNNGLKALFSMIPSHGNPPAGWPGWRF